MSAVFTLVQSRAAFMIVDSATYLPDRTLVSTNVTKATVLATLPAVISATGPSLIANSFADRIATEFDSFDDLINRGSGWMVERFSELADEGLKGDAAAAVYVIGWSKARNDPAAYHIDLWTEGPAHEQWLRNSAAIPGFDPDAIKMEFSDISANITGSPMPEISSLSAKCFTTRAPDDYHPEVDLVHLIELARHKVVDGNLAVGGKALLVRVDSHGITQRVVHEWPEDRPGSKISAIEPDWREFRRSLEARFAAASTTTARADEPPLGLNRQQRLAWKAKNRKHA